MSVGARQVIKVVEWEWSACVQGYDSHATWKRKIRDCCFARFAASL